MSTILKTLAVITAILAAFVLSLWHFYQPLVSGTIYLADAPGVASISYEEATGIAHIRGQDLNSALYAQGFQHAQSRLWQIYKQRAAYRGELSEFFGKQTIPLDTFARTIGYTRVSRETWKTLTKELQGYFEAYCAGVNAYVDSISLSGDIAKIFPPEFYLLNVELKPYLPTDVLSAIMIMHMGITWDWLNDLVRDIHKMESQELMELSEQLTPFSSHYLHNLVTILDDDDLKQMGRYSEKTLSERYFENINHLRAAEPKRDRAGKPRDKEALAQEPPFEFGFEDSMHSNSWVIHGDHTSTGKPMLANDPHLGTSIPTFWQLNELIWEDKFLIGAGTPGIPFMGVGKSKMTSWGMTSPNCDSSDMWQETIDDEGKSYLVDGVWRKLNVVQETIKVKGSEPLVLDIKSTHRGPLFSTDVLIGAEGVFFGNYIPEPKVKHQYSLAWAGNYPGESFLPYVIEIAKGKTVREVMDFLVENGDGGFRGIPMNAVFADNTGDIGYIMLAGIPNRKDKTPNLGNRVFDGETSAYDWDGLTPVSQLPMIVNPKKGYFATANNRPVSDHSVNDIGANSMSTGRAQRIDEMIKDMIKKNHKITVEDMLAIQQDDTDIIAREFTPKMIKIGRQVASQLSPEQRHNMESIFKHLEGWNGRFDQESIGATCYSYTQFYFLRSLMHRQYPGDATRRWKVVDQISFIDFHQRLLLDVERNPEDSLFNSVCKDANDYQGKSNCAYNLAVAFSEAYTFMETQLSKKPEDWAWKNVHTNIYNNLPWNKIPPLKFFFNREVAAAGNTHTPSVSRFFYRSAIETMRFQGIYAANYKQIVTHEETGYQGVNLWSIDTGARGNVFAGNFFDMNENHLAGKLHKMYIGPQIQEISFTTLIIKPIAKQTKSGGQSDL